MRAEKSESMYSQDDASDVENSSYLTRNDQSHKRGQEQEVR